MQRYRKIAGPPTRTATAAWDVVTRLINDTLTASPRISVSEVTTAFSSLNGIGAALVAGGHLETEPLVLVSNSLYVNFTITTGDAAVETEENLNPVPGGSVATSNWVLYVPSPAPLTSILSAAVKQSAHFSVDPAPPYSSTEATATAGSLLDLSALDGL